MSDTADYRAECTECPWKGNKLANRLTVKSEADIHAAQAQHEVKIIVFEVAPDEIRFISDRQNFDEQTFKELFNEYRLKPVNLEVSNPKSLLEMTDEELVAWVNKMDDFVRLVKVASTTARLRLQDRKLELTTEQQKALEALDRSYRPKTIKEKKVKEPKEKDGTWNWVKTAADKKVAATMKILGMSKEDAEKWVLEQTKS